MARLIIVFSLLLSACGQDTSIDPVATNHGYGWDYDQSGDSGTRVHYADTAHPGVDFSIIEGWFLKMEECTGIKTNGPLVAITAQQLISPAGESVSGITYFDTGLIVVTDMSVQIGNTGLVVKHEMIHYLLWMSGFPNDRNSGHDSPYFYNRDTDMGCETLI